MLLQALYNRPRYVLVRGRVLVYLCPTCPTGRVFESTVATEISRSRFRFQLVVRLVDSRSAAAGLPSWVVRPWFLAQKYESVCRRRRSSRPSLP